MLLQKEKKRETQQLVQATWSCMDLLVGQGATIFQLLTGEDQALLVWWNAFLVLNLGLDVVNGV